METLGDRLRAMRKDRGLSLEEVSDQLGYAVNSVGRWEREDVYPSVPALMDLRDFYNVSIDWMLTGKEWQDGKAFTILVQ